MGTCPNISKFPTISGWTSNYYIITCTHLVVLCLKTSHFYAKQLLAISTEDLKSNFGDKLTINTLKHQN